MPKLKILHTSDIHLEAKAAWLGERAGEYRKQLVGSFESLVTVAKKKDVNIVLITGDLFDTPFPSNTAIEIVKNTLLKFAEAGIYVALIPGNHDYMAEGSVYKTKDLAQGNEKIIVFNDPSKQVFEIAELGVRLFAKANTMQKSQESPLPKLVKEEGTEKFFNIALAHGSFDVKGEKAENYPITQEAIENSGFDYVALGDWHGMLNTGAIQTKAFYPGSLEPLAVDQKNAGSGLLVSLEEGREVQVQPVKVGHYEVADVEIDISNADNILKSIESAIAEQAAEGELTQKIVNIKLTGSKSIEKPVEIEKIEEYFAGKYFHFRVQDKSTLQMTQEQLTKYPEHTVVGKFINLIQERTDLDDATKSRVLEKGVALLTSG
ncbi:hypothetical protein GF389_03480 [Candidatus Dojkabacteria bacterium]|nr:hypothetical protein [Candidatus Dojkabacteria bacterium]